MRMRWAGHGKKRNAYRILVGSQKEIVQYKDLEVGGRIILKLDAVVWTGFIWLRIGTNG
jgi:hypothetical protein